MSPGLRSVSRETLLLPVHTWRLISRTILPPRCKYHPSCSQYCLDAVRQRGVFAGVALAAWRLLRCNPWSLGGIDHVPRSGFRSTASSQRRLDPPESTQ
ncbi:MAG: rane protein insertion efficiency factor YidD [Thermoleophilia bacterium]|nr:rane protein insertion efficiency factor YidD [Thermoleophilia bacterium]